MDEVRVHEYSDSELKSGDYMYHEQDQQIHVVVKGQKSVKAEFKAAVLSDPVTHNIYYKSEDKWKVIAADVYESFFVKVVQVLPSMTMYDLSFSCDCKVLYSQLPVCDSIVDLTCLGGGADATVVLDCKGELRILIFKRPGFTQYYQMEVTCETSIALPRGLTICASTPENISYNSGDGTVDLSRLGVGDEFVLSTVSGDGCLAVYVINRYAPSFAQALNCLTIDEFCSETPVNRVIKVSFGVNGPDGILNAIADVQTNGPQFTMIQVTDAGTYSGALLISGDSTSNLSGLQLVATAGATIATSNGVPPISVEGTLRCIKIIGFNINSNDQPSIYVNNSSGAYTLPLSVVIENNNIGTNGMNFLGIVINSGAVVKIINNIFNDSTVNQIDIIDSVVLIQNNTIFFNDAGAENNAISIFSQNQLSIAYICGNSISSTTGIANRNNGIITIGNSCSTYIIGNTISGFLYGVNVQSNFSQTFIQKNTITGNAHGIYNTTYTSIVTDNTFSMNTTYDIYDSTSGGYTAQTANIYCRNSCTSDNKSGTICGCCT